MAGGCADSEPLARFEKRQEGSYRANEVLIAEYSIHNYAAVLTPARSRFANVAPITGRGLADGGVIDEIEAPAAVDSGARIE